MKKWAVVVLLLYGLTILIFTLPVCILAFLNIGSKNNINSKELLQVFTYWPYWTGFAFGFDRLVSMFAGLDSIRDVIAFPKNNSGRDVMNDSPAEISQVQLDELYISLIQPKIKG